MLPDSSHLAVYRACLDRLRRAGGRVRHLPGDDFYLLGMGQRRKLVYQRGLLADARSGEVLRAWEVEGQTILPSEYAVLLDLRGGGQAAVYEDERGVWLYEGGQPNLLSEGRVRLPRFESSPYAPALRALHQEVLVNVLDGLPLPNFFVYRRPWYRDGAMMGMVLQRTGNLHLIRDWASGLREPYDRNNAGEEEADNLGQALYLISLVSDAAHPLVTRVLREMARFDAGGYLRGRSDFAEHPVYQTKWARFGLAALGLPDPYRIPRLPDSYSALFWWAYQDEHVPGVCFNELDYPYLDWAEAHFYGEPGGPWGDRDYPLSWEARASQADYAALAPLFPAYAAEAIAAPHTWHAAEMFLYLHGKST